MSRLWILCACLIVSCVTDHSVESGDSPSRFSFRQVPGCLATSNTRDATPDSCFRYAFDDETLSLEFCVTGNCCPDTDRFDVSIRVSQTVIGIAVADTAANLCRCICPYLLQVEIRDLMLNEYQVNCDADSVRLYSETVKISSGGI